MQRTQPPADTSTIEERARWMLDNLHGGKQGRLAAAIGVSTATISRIFHEKQKIGPRLAVALAAHPAVNPAWVSWGRGDPLAATDLPPPEVPGGRMLPVYPKLLTGSPERLFSLATFLFPVLRIYFNENCYWYEVPADDPIVGDDRWAIRPGDLLLLNYDVAEWVEIGRLCVYRRGSGKDAIGVLVELTDKLDTASIVATCHQLVRMNP
jgi:DNA-binding XRE family transcriptional regulator